MEKVLTKEEKSEGLQKLLETILKIEPLDYKSPKSELDYEQRFALAQVYALKGYRSYLENAINRFIYASAVNSNDEISLACNRARIILLKELLILAKKSWEEIDKLNKDAKAKKAT